MKKMKLARFKGMLEDHLGLSFVVLAVVFLLIGSMVVPSFTAAADEEDEETAPEWVEGDMWRYEELTPMPEEDIIIEFERRVTDESRIIMPTEDGGEESFDTYVVTETIYHEDGGQNRTDIHFWEDNLAEIYNIPHEDENRLPTGYAPPVVELDFPLWEGKEWSGEARFFVNPENRDDSEPDRKYAYEGGVENITTKEIGIGEFEETYMINLHVEQYREEDGQTVIEQVRRYEIYYSPDVRNIIHKDIFETQYWEEEDEYREEWIGEETLVAYDLEPVEDDDEEEASLLGVGVFLVIIGVGTAIFTVYKKVKRGF